MLACLGHAPAVDAAHVVMVDQGSEDWFHSGASSLDQTPVIGFVSSKLLMHSIVQRLVDGVVDFLERCVFPDAFFSQGAVPAYLFTAAVALHLVPFRSHHLLLERQDGFVASFLHTCCNQQLIMQNFWQLRMQKNWQQ